MSCPEEGQLYLPKHLSYSAVSKWLKCPMCWYESYACKSKMIASKALYFGQAMSHTLQALHKGENHETDWAQSWAHFDRLLTSRGFSNLEPGFEVGLALLESYREQGIFSGQPEQYLELVVPGLEVPVVMYLDIHTGDGVGEFKTSRQKWDQERVDTELQGTFYWAGFQQAHGRDPDHLTYVIMPTSKDPVVRYYETTRDQADLDNMMELIKEVWAEMQTGHYPGLCSVHRGTLTAKTKPEPPELILDDEEPTPPEALADEMP